MFIDDIGPPGAGLVNNCVCSSTESSPRTWPACETTDQGNHVPSLRGEYLLASHRQTSRKSIKKVKLYEFFNAM